MKESEKAKESSMDPAEDVEALGESLLRLSLAVVKKCEDCRGGLAEASCCDDKSCCLNPVGPLSAASWVQRLDRCRERLRNFAESE